MKKQSFFVFVCFLFLAAGLWKFYGKQNSGSVDFSSRAPAQIPHDLQQAVIEFNQFISDRHKFTLENCADSLNGLFDQMNTLEPTYFASQRLNDPAVFKDIVQGLWQARLTLRDRLKEWLERGQLTQASGETHACTLALRKAHRASRFVEEYLGIYVLKPKPFDKDKDKVGTTLRGEFPALQTRDDQPMTLRSGDVFMSRGNAFTSAAIARIGAVEGQFSHVAVLYIKDREGQEFTVEEAMADPSAIMLEAHIEVGSTIRPIKEYLDDGNARVVQYRYPDAKIAHAAAKASYDFLKETEKQRQKKLKCLFSDVNCHAPYDFKMDLKDRSEIFCSEMAEYGYSKQGVQMPQFATEIRKNNDLIKRLGIVVSHTFAPSDMEVETRFEMLSEWKDYRKIRKLQINDAILSEMFYWMKEFNYKFYPTTLMNTKAAYATAVRWTDAGYKKDFPKNMTFDTKTTMMILMELEPYFGKIVSDANEKYQKENNGLFLTIGQMQKALRDSRTIDPEFKKLGGIFKPAKAP